MKRLGSVGHPEWKVSAVPFALGAAEGHVFTANPREVLVFDQEGRVVHRQGSNYAFQAADFRGLRGVTADKQLQLRLWQLPELQETKRWLFDHENRTYGFEECQVTALALDDDGLWVGIHDVSWDPEESRFMEPEFKTTFSLRRYSLDGTLKRSTALPSKVTHIKVHGSGCWVGLESGGLARLQGTDLHIFDGSPSCTALEVHEAAVWVGRLDGSVEQRHPDSGEILRQCTSQAGQVTSLCAMDDNLWVGCDDGTLDCRQPMTLAGLAQSRPALGKITRMARWQGRLLCAGTRWLAFPEDPPRPGHSGHLEAVAFSAAGNELATAGYDQTVRLWDLESGREKVAFRGHRGPVRNLAYAADKVVSAGKDGTIRIWSPTAGLLHCHLTDRRLSPEIDGPGPWSRAGEPLSALAVSGDSLFWGGDGRGLETLRLSTLQLQPGLSTLPNIRALACNSLGQLLVGTDHGVQLICWPEGTVLASAGRSFDHYIHTVWHSDSLGAAATSDGIIQLFSGEKAELSFRLKTLFLAGIAFDEQGRLLSASVEEDGDWLRLWDLSGRPLAQHSLSGAPTCLTCQANQLAVGRADGSVERFLVTS